MTNFIIYALWAVLCWLCYKIGWQTGVGDGTYVTLTELNKQKIIHIDPKTEEIRPGTARKQHMGDVIEKVNFDE
jgi:hypothetical protein